MEVKEYKLKSLDELKKYVEDQLGKKIDTNHISNKVVVTPEGKIFRFLAYLEEDNKFIRHEVIEMKGNQG